MCEFIRLTALAALLTLPGLCGAQEHSAQGGQSSASSTSADQNKNSSSGTSLGDVARKSRQEKNQDKNQDKSTVKPVKVYTNENIPTSGGISQAAATPTTSDAATPGAAPGAATNADAKSATPAGRDEKAWRDKFAQLRRKLETDKQDVEVMQRELGTLSLQYYPDPNKAMQQQLSRDDINKKTADIEKKKKDIAADQQAIEDAQDDLRKAGGDPGWAR